MRCDCVKVRKRADRYRRGVIRVKRGRLDDSWIDPLYWIDNNPLRIIGKKNGARVDTSRTTYRRLLRNKSK